MDQSDAHVALCTKTSVTKTTQGGDEGRGYGSPLLLTEGKVGTTPRLCGVCGCEGWESGKRVYGGEVLTESL